jgi:thiamine-monophosphate kinase
MIQFHLSQLYKSVVFSEFEIIRHYFFQASSTSVLGVGDDAAIVAVSSGKELVVSTDTLVSGQHFFADTDPYKLGHKSLAVNLSDMAAMGAKPRWALLALTLPKQLIQQNNQWLDQFSKGFHSLAHEHHVELIGGDTTSGPLNICVQMMGEIDQGKALLRSNAQPNDDIWVSGCLGEAAMGLAHEQQRVVLQEDEIERCLSALLTPNPRIRLGVELINLAHSAIDISDGLLADLGHILDYSGVGATININAIACSVVLQNYLPQPHAIHCLLAGGDDYELCFTAPSINRREINHLSNELSIPLSCIGQITEAKGLTVLDSDGSVLTLENKGYDHFNT